MAFSILLLGSSSAFAQLELLPSETMPTVFADRPATIQAIFRNTGEKTLQCDLRTRIYQASAATLMPMGEPQRWKKLEIPAGKTLIESVSVTLPSVRAATKFQVRWIDEKSNPIARTDVMAYPDNLLGQLKDVAGDKPIGVIDPENQLKPLLKKQEIDFEDLEDGNAFDKFDGKLAIVGPFSSKAQLPRHARERIADRAKAGVAIVWILPPPTPRPAVHPLAWPVRLGAGVVIVAQSSTVAGLARSPLSQLNLIRFAEMALNPNALQLPEQ